LTREIEKHREITKTMEEITFLLGWMMVILLLAAPILVPFIIVKLFFGGVIAFVKGIASGQLGNIFLAVLMLAAAAGATIAYMRWNGFGTKVKAHTDISFVEGVLSPEMLVRPRAWHGRFPHGAYASDVLEHLMLPGKIDTMVGDRRYLPLQEEKQAPYPQYWDETFRLKLTNPNCLRSLIGTAAKMDECFASELLESNPNETHFGFGMATNEPASETLYYYSGSSFIQIAKCTVTVERPILPTLYQVLDVFRATEFLRTGKLRVGKMSPHDKKEFDEMRKCRVKLLRQFATMI
jgi:hypothetical protein